MEEKNLGGRGQMTLSQPEVELNIGHNLPSPKIRAKNYQPRREGGRDIFVPIPEGMGEGAIRRK